MGDLPQPEQDVLSHTVWTPLERGNSNGSVISVTAPPSAVSAAGAGALSEHQSIPTTLPEGMNPGPGQVLINVPAGQAQALQTFQQQPSVSSVNGGLGVTISSSNSSNSDNDYNKVDNSGGGKRLNAPVETAEGREEQDSKRMKLKQAST